MKTTIFTLFAVLLTLSVSAQTPFLHYSFENNLNDKVGTNHATHVAFGDGNTSAVYSAGKVGQCYEITATAALGTNYVKSPAGLLNPNNAATEFTVLGWFFYDSSAESRNGNIPMVALNAGTDPAAPEIKGTQRNIILLTWRGSENKFMLLNTYLPNAAVPILPAATAVTGSETMVVTADAWHHIAVSSTINSTDNTKKDLKVYLDGVLVGELASATLSNAWGELTLGYKDVSGTTSASLIYNGKVDEFAVYNSALTQTQISNIMTNGISTAIENTTEAKFFTVSTIGNKVKVNMNNDFNQSKLIVSDLSGKSVFEKANFNETLITPAFDKGVYFVTVIKNDKKITEKIIIF